MLQSNLYVISAIRNDSKKNEIKESFRMNRISFDEALISLKDMFPQYDEETLRSVVIQYSTCFFDFFHLIDGRMEEVITSLLIMNGQESPAQYLSYITNSLD